jgi:cytosine/adenosine deaminase-related metal-dependent hydrolase
VSVLVLDGCAVVTMDPERREYDLAHIVIDEARLVGVFEGPARRDLLQATYIDAAGCLATPGLVNTHHHLYQWATRGLAVDHTLFEWLTTLYPIWAGLDEDVVRIAATGALGWLARTGCTTSMDHHYVFPHGGGDLVGAEIAAATDVGLRLLATRGSMDLGQSQGGLPPDEVVEDVDTILDATATAIDTYHDPRPDSTVRIGVAPCSPFTVTADLMTQAAALARDKGVRLHTHLAETLDEEDFCRERFNSSPVEYVESLGWLGPDVWMAHSVHLDDAAIARYAATGTGAAHCPSSNARLGAGVARVRDLRDAGVPVGLGVDGAASNEAAALLEEARHAALFARAVGGPRALTVRDALELATIGGAAVLGWADQIGSLEEGKLADIALWRMDTLAHADIDDPVAGLVLGAPPPLELLLVHGRRVVERDRLTRVEEQQVAQDVRRARETLLTRAGVTA